MALQPKSLRAAAVGAPARRFVSVTPNDAADLPGGATRAVFVGGAGLLAVVGAGGGEVELLSGDAQYHPIEIVRVLSRTTATGVIALY
ncbi:spike base protein, RCAP_Rcc01079 family [Rubrimonas cliftonensis]|uniref:Uncharacterized protein n=1 Tax=Rubrimonas cliftonensis TaxID=89524 RepID=A0A1H4CVD3_9RHOB|nr:hypothetical protein [Rubrimonas cliftonensis]SEA64351.1 hypothetical protein SAMN05444370_10857 [Rubrimonas cliftonensis]